MVKDFKSVSRLKAFSRHWPQTLPLHLGSQFPCFCRLLGVLAHGSSPPKNISKARIYHNLHNPKHSFHLAICEQNRVATFDTKSKFTLSHRFVAGPEIIPFSSQIFMETLFKTVAFTSRITFTSACDAKINFTFYCVSASMSLLLFFKNCFEKHKTKHSGISTHNA